MSSFDSTPCERPARGGSRSPIDVDLRLFAHVVHRPAASISCSRGATVKIRRADGVRRRCRRSLLHGGVRNATRNLAWAGRRASSDRVASSSPMVAAGPHMMEHVRRSSRQPLRSNPCRCVAVPPVGSGARPGVAHRDGLPNTPGGSDAAPQDRRPWIGNGRRLRRAPRTALAFGGAHAKVWAAYARGRRARGADRAAAGPHLGRGRARGHPGQRPRAVMPSRLLGVACASPSRLRNSSASRRYLRLERGAAGPGGGGAGRGGGGAGARTGRRATVSRR